MRKQVILLVAGGAAAQAITLCVVPLLTRYYSPTEFGLFGLFAACVSVLGSAATLRYELAIVIPKDRSEAASVFVLCIPIALLIAAITLAFVCMFGDGAAKLLGQPQLVTVLWWLPLSVLAFGTFEALNYWATSAGKFNELIVSQVSRSFLVALIQVLCGLFGAGGSGLIAGQVGAHSLVALGWLRQTWHRDHRILRPEFQSARLKQTARRYDSFPRFGAPQAVVNAISQTLPLFLIGIFFSPQILGLYVLAQRIMQAPMQLMASSLRQVILPRYAKLRVNDQKISSELLSLSISLILVVVMAVSVTMIYGDNFFAWAFGERWRIAGIFAGWLSAGIFMSLAVAPASSVLTVMEKQKVQLGFEIVTLIGRSLAIIVGARMDSALTAIALFSVTGATLNFGLIILAGWFCRTHEARVALHAKMAS